MPDRPAELIRLLDLRPHPEGGHYREVFRSTETVAPADGRPARSALTSIYFLLGPGESSRWHRVASDEAWHFYEGAGLELLRLAPDLLDVKSTRLGPPADAGPWGTVRPTATVPAGHWQAARPTDGGYALVGCTVGPGFDFADFELMSGTPDADRVRRLHPEWAGMI